MIIEAPSLWQWMLLFALLLIASFALRLTLKQGQNSASSNALVVLAYVGILLAISGLILQPKIADYEGQVITLHLPDAQPLQVLPKGHNLSLGVNPDFPEMPTVMSVQALSVLYPNMSRLQLNGTQLPLYGLSQLDVDSIIAMQDAPQQGLSKLNWQKQLYQGQTLTIEGNYHFADKPLHKLTLLDIAGEVVDNLTVKSGESFVFQILPKAVGPVHYQLKNADGALLADLNLYVQDGAQENTLIWASAPDAELNNLKNWLLADDQAVMTNIDISANKTLTQKSDSAQTPENSRLVVMDGRKLTRLNSLQLASLENDIKSGKGLIVLADTELLDFAWLQNLGIELENYQREEQNVQAFSLPDFQFEAALNVADLVFSDTSADNALIYNGQGQVLAVKQRLGAGHIVISLLSDSFTLQRQQQQTAYSRYWQTLISAALPVHEQGRILPLQKSVITHVNLRTKVCALVTNPNTKLRVKSTTESYLIPLFTSAQRQSMACSYFWPTQAGWYQMTLQDGAFTDTAGIHVYPADAFADIRSFQLHQYIKELDDYSRTKDDKLEAHYRPVPAYWFALLWLCCAAYLWWRKR